MRRFVWLAAAFVVAVGLLFYARSRLPVAGAERPPETGVARPSGDRQALLAGLFQGALLNTPDGQDFAETPSYRRLLYHVHSMPAEDFSRRVTGWLDWSDAMAHPAQWRGEFVKVRGVVASLKAVKLHGTDAGIEDAWRGFLFEPDGSEPVVFDLADVPPPVRVDTAVKDTLDVEGVFYRVVKYDAVDGSGATVQREVPYLVARNLSIVQAAAPPQSPLVVGLQVLGVALASVLAALFLARRAGRSRRAPPQAGIRELFEARLHEGGRPSNEDKPT